MKHQTIKMGFDDKTKDGGYTRATAPTESKITKWVLKCFDTKDKLAHKLESANYAELKEKMRIWNALDKDNWSTLKEF
jgi:hypothetical protein